MALAARMMRSQSYVNLSYIKEYSNGNTLLRAGLYNPDRLISFGYITLAYATQQHRARTRAGAARAAGRGSLSP